MLKLVSKKGALSVVNDQVGSPTHAVDLSRAIYVLTEKGCQGIYHITNGGTCSWYEYAQEILAISGLGNISVHPISSDQLNRAAKRPCNSVLDRGKFERETGYRMRPWREALRDYLKIESKP
jgi:dTDP-4-dehydrorhamnose reductase